MHRILPIAWSLYSKRIPQSLVLSQSQGAMKSPARKDAWGCTYNGCAWFPHMREWFCMTAWHHMVLRDEDIRNLKLSDTFCIQQKHNTHGSQLATGLVFAILHGKTNKQRVRLFATAFRHKDFLQCTVGAFAFYMFEWFHVSCLFFYIHHMWFIY